MGEIFLKNENFKDHVILQGGLGKGKFLPNIARERFAPFKEHVIC